MEALGKEEPVALERAKAGVNLISVCGAEGRLAEARRVLKVLRELPGGEEVKVLKGKATYNLVIDLVRAGFIDESRDLYHDEALLGPHPELLIPRGRLGVVLVRSFAEARRFKEAEELLEEMAGLGDSREMKLFRENASFELKRARNSLNYPRIRGLGKDA